MQRISLAILFVISAAAVARAADDFADKVDVSPLQTIALQHRQTIKTLDSFARQMLTAITGRGTLDGRPAVYTILDMAARPEEYAGRNIIKIRNVPLRQDLQRLDFISTAQKERIV